MNSDPQMSARPCGCDPGCGHECEFHASLHKVSHEPLQHVAKEDPAFGTGMPTVRPGPNANEMFVSQGPHVPGKFMRYSPPASTIVLDTAREAMVMFVKHELKMRGEMTLYGRLPVLAERAVDIAQALEQALQKRLSGGQDA